MTESMEHLYDGVKQYFGAEIPGASLGLKDIIVGNYSSGTSLSVMSESSFNVYTSVELYLLATSLKIM